jgi:chemotaxis protein methyltransferase CheR
MWQTLRYSILPKFKTSESIKIWHAGCSTGQEVYSMMILLNELELLEKAELYGTDINSEALEIAKKGEYKYRFNLNYLDNFDNVIREIPGTKQLDEVPYSTYFAIDEIKDTISMKKFLVEKPTFTWHNLASPEGFQHGQFDLILCRNVIIYFNFSLQERLFKHFLECLNPKGILVLGAHESMIGPVSERFEKVKQMNIKK